MSTPAPRFFEKSGQGRSRGENGASGQTARHAVRQTVGFAQIADFAKFDGFFRKTR